MIPREQLRMTQDELDSYLGEQRTLRLATVDDHGTPHVVPLWFVWHDGAIWLNSLRRTRRHRHLLTGRRVGLVVDDGEAYGELRGVRMTGTPAAVPDDDAVRVAAYRRFGTKYFGREELPSQQSYETIRITPDDVASWDFRKIPAGRDRKVGLDSAGGSA
jgi:nitroimidazol reductase NimA-like FMN-containing flavoprotein (pyridoxamine 5'-phosphate oxidase superfamily)